ncbi:RNA-directed DNA polymerase from mobile element jockey-like [Brachionus plicatilis]|uniref:RNA-directed DNA polymerase from mobile element jockey-like n=1 Tax=Brachionus plicatilis TaxID=10195 RepID=A0A3M7SJK2_BRAPC|nr:RNA-directed DNA polymerase from mobile element jockey-like [Brachionus plicatilis]
MVCNKYQFSQNKKKKHYVNDSAPLGAREQAHIRLTWEYQLATCTSEVSTSSRYKYNQGEYAKLNKAFETANWDKLFTEQDVNRCYNSFISIYNSACDTFIPKIKHHKVIRKKVPWMNQELKQLIMKKKLAGTKFEPQEEKIVSYNLNTLRQNLK